MWKQVEFKLKPRARGFHLVTDEVIKNVPDIVGYQVGMLNLFIKHSSASLTINENADPSVRQDMEAFFLQNVPDDSPYFVHTYEGPDDMPAHIKSVLIGADINIPIRNGELALGTWQGIYLGEHRVHGGARSLVATLNGEFS